MIHLTLSSQKLAPENTFPERFSLILNQPLLMKSEQELTGSFSILSSLFQEKKMQRTIMPEDTIRLERRSSISCWIESENLLITARGFKASFCITPLVGVPELVLVRYF